MKIHFLGASGSGVSTLGKKLSDEMGWSFFDGDDYYWKITDPPYRVANSVEKRQRLLLTDLEGIENWIISGTMCGWSEPIEPLYNFVVYLYVPSNVRIERLKEREKKRFGSRILEGGDMYQQYMDFIEWAAQYDEGVMGGRSKKTHERWMKTLSCSIIKFEGDHSLESLVSKCKREMGL